MAKVAFVDGAKREMRATSRPAGSDAPPDAEDPRLCVHHPGDDETPELFEVQLPAGYVVESHAHEADEIIVIMEGEAKFGKHRYGAGSSVFVPAMTLYAFEAGADGVRFLNFRPVRTPGRIPREDLLARRRSATTTA